jgi:hypothetical protein
MEWKATKTDEIIVTSAANPKRAMGEFPVWIKRCDNFTLSMPNKNIISILFPVITFIFPWSFIASYYWTVASPDKNKSGESRAYEMKIKSQRPVRPRKNGYRPTSRNFAIIKAVLHVSIRPWDSFGVHQARNRLSFPVYTQSRPHMFIPLAPQTSGKGWPNYISLRWQLNVSIE